MATSELEVSLVDAIRKKYDAFAENFVYDNVKEIALIHKPGLQPVQRRKSMAFEGFCISAAGDVAQLAELCPEVSELHLSSNKITRWEEVCKILRGLQAAIFLDLSSNPLLSETFVTPLLCSIDHSPCSLTTLVLNSVFVSSAAVQTFLDVLPRLQELHLCGNRYEKLDLKEGSSYPHLLKLYISSNQISAWAELQRLGKVFPSLQVLVSASNPLTTIPPLEKEAASSAFGCLITLNLNNTLIDSWVSLEHLQDLPSLTELNILKVPIGRDMQEKERRFEAIGRLPKLSVLNKSVVGAKEREEAERWMIRTYKEQYHCRPAGYTDLQSKHGELCPLANVDLTPASEVDLEFHIEGRDPELHRTSVHQSVLDLKKWLSKMLGVPLSTLILYFGALETIEAYGLEEMRFNAKLLYTYWMKNNDRIYVNFRT